MAKAEKYVNAAWLLGEHGEVGDHLAQIYEKRGRKDAAINTYAMAMSGIRPTLETRGRLAALVGGEAKVPAAIEQHRLALQATRAIKMGKIAPAAGTAGFFGVVNASPASSTIRGATV